MPPSPRSLLALAGLALLGAGCVDPIEPPSRTADGEFTNGSGVAVQTLTEPQVENLVLLGKIWGFAKYHHPAVTSGQLNWDYELFRVLPRILAAPDRITATSALSAWLDGFGPVAPCTACATPNADAQLQPDIGWIDDIGALGASLAEQLKTIYRNRTQSDVQHYVTLRPNFHNPVFSKEARYGEVTQLDAGYRLLGLFRFWNIIEYWYAYRNLIDEDWDNVLREFVPRFVSRSLNSDEYGLELIQLAVRTNDTRVNIGSALMDILGGGGTSRSDAQPPAGPEDLMVHTRFIEGKFVVSGYRNATNGPWSGLHIGDVIEQVDGQPAASLVEAWRPYYPASNEATMLRDMGRNLTRGSGSIQVQGHRAEGPVSVSPSRIPFGSPSSLIGHTHELPGPTFQMLDDDVAYMKLSTLTAAQLPGYIEQALGARLLVLDLRNHPPEPVFLALGGHLVTATTPFARSTYPSIANPGTMRWGATVSITPRAPHFRGAVAILVDEITQAATEYHAMAFQAAPNAFVVGSNTAGADGTLSRIPMPGNIEMSVVGTGVFYPDGRSKQRIGIVPDVFVRPTIAGLRAGRDEVLEAAVGRALSRRH